MQSIYKISKLSCAVLLPLILSLSTLVAQNDTMYVMKNGVVVGKYNVNTQVDGVLFNNPTITSPTSGDLNTVTDYDGNVYRTVTIGTQVWMSENLKTTKYSDGTAIPLVTGDSNWDALDETDQAYCFPNDDVANKAVFGALYTWSAAMKGAASSTANPSKVQGICPTGWHLPSSAEWDVLIKYLGNNGYNYDGTVSNRNIVVAKSLASNYYWSVSDKAGSVGSSDYPTYRNKSGFSALPASSRLYNGSFNELGLYAFWLSATEENTLNAKICKLYYSDTFAERTYFRKEGGYSVRCVKD